MGCSTVAPSRVRVSRRGVLWVRSRFLPQRCALLGHCPRDFLSCLTASFSLLQLAEAGSSSLTTCRSPASQPGGIGPDRQRHKHSPGTAGKHLGSTPIRSPGLECSAPESSLQGLARCNTPNRTGKEMKTDKTTKLTKVKCPTCKLILLIKASLTFCPACRSLLPNGQKG